MSDQLRRAVVLAEIIREAVAGTGPDGLPSGVLYAQMMAVGCDLESYERMISMLEDTGWIRRRGHVLFPGTKAAP